MSAELPIRPGRARSADRLVADHAGLVRKLAWGVHRQLSSSVEMEDLVQIGLMALVEAAQNFEPRGEASFAGYAAVRIRGAMIDELRRQATLNRGAMRRRRALVNAETALSRELGRAPDPEEMAEKLGMSLAAYGSAADEARGLRQESLDDVYSDHVRDFASDEASAFDLLEREQLRKFLAQAIRKLPEREALVLQLYFVEELSLEEIGEVLDVGAARVCQIKRAALDRLRQKLSASEA